MRFSTLSHLALVSSAAAANPLLEARQDNATETNINADDTAAKMSEFISVLGLTGTATFSTAVPTCLGGYDPPPPSLYHMILTAVPGSVLGQLANGAGRSSISAAMAAGSTPEWYAAMPTEVKSYISSLNANKGTGCTTPPTKTKTASAENKAGATGGAGVFVDENGDLQTSTSSDFAAATQVAKGGLAGIVAFVGLMAVL